MRKTSLSKVSDKQEKELALRRWMHYTLWVEQEGKCANCGRVLKYSESELSHKKHIGMGGCKDKTKTTRENCEVTCASWMSGCHPNKEHNQRNIYDEQPQWSLKEKEDNTGVRILSVSSVRRYVTWQYGVGRKLTEPVRLLVMLTNGARLCASRLCQQAC